MTYHQKAIVYTSDSKGKGKAVYWEDDNGKITKKTKNINSQSDVENIYKQFGFDDPILDVERFMNFNISSPFRLLSGLADNFFGNSFVNQNIEENQKSILPEDVEIDKHRKRLEELREKKRIENQKEAEKEQEKKYLQCNLEELKNIKKELKNGGDIEGVKSIEEDIKKIEEKMKKCA